MDGNIVLHYPMSEYGCMSQLLWHPWTIPGWEYSPGLCLVRVFMDVTFILTSLNHAFVDGNSVLGFPLSGYLGLFLFECMACSILVEERQSKATAIHTCTNGHHFIWRWLFENTFNELESSSWGLRQEMGMQRTLTSNRDQHLGDQKREHLANEALLHNETPEGSEARHW